MLLDLRSLEEATATVGGGMYNGKPYTWTPLRGEKWPWRKSVDEEALLGMLGLAVLADAEDRAKFFD